MAEAEDFHPHTRLHPHQHSMNRDRTPVASVALWCVQGSSCRSQHQGLPLQQGLCRSCFCSASLGARPSPSSSVMPKSAPPHYHPSMTGPSTMPPKIKRRESHGSRLAAAATGNRVRAKRSSGAPIPWAGTRSTLEERTACTDGLEQS